jgi:hypothetical protein
MATRLGRFLRPTVPSSMWVEGVVHHRVRESPSKAHLEEGGNDPKLYAAAGLCLCTRAVGSFALVFRQACA